ncbi:MAG: ribonuclease III [Lachnospiraceae bacterium]|nr:ribonuclease III [Lachnospiraceae bacterium]
MGEDLTSLIRERFGYAEIDAKQYSPLTLAFVGDAVYSLLIRTKLLCERELTVNHLHKHAADEVKAEAQKDLMNAMLPRLTEEEMTVFKRGRNAKSYTVAKHASVTDYRIATGFEALLGFLYLNGRTDRIMELVFAKDDGEAAGQEG